jgi:hypothetical protein
VTSTAELNRGTLTIPTSGRWSYTVIGVVHAPASPPPPPPGHAFTAPAILPGTNAVTVYGISTTGYLWQIHWDATAGWGPWVNDGTMPGGL